MSQTHHDQNSHDTHGDHEHAFVDPGEVIAEKSPQDQMLIGVCAIAMTLLMICMGTWMQIPTPSGGGHSGHSEHSATNEQPHHSHETGTHPAQESHENQSH